MSALQALGLTVKAGAEAVCAKSGYAASLLVHESAPADKHASAALSPAPAQAAAATDGAALPSGWTERWSKRKGRPYYHCAETGDVVWERPEGAAVSASRGLEAASKSGKGSRGRWWALEYPAPLQYLADGSPTGQTLLKKRHLGLLGVSLVSVSSAAWDRNSASRELREAYLKRKLNL